MRNGEGVGRERYGRRQSRYCIRYRAETEHKCGYCGSVPEPPATALTSPFGKFCRLLTATVHRHLETAVVHSAL